MITRKKLLLSVFIYGLLLIAFGYDPVGESAGVFSLALKKVYPSLYSKDIFIQSLQENFLHERTFFVFLIVPIALFPFLGLVYHAFISVFFLLALINLAEFFLTKKNSVFLFVLLYFFVFYPLNWGGNEMYYTNIQASNLSKTLLVWSLLFFLMRNFVRAVSLLTIGTLVHPLVGLQAFVLFSPFWLPELNKNLKYFFPGFFIAGSYILGLFLVSQGNSSLSFQEYKQIMLDFRHPGHFVPHCFSKKGLLVFSFFSLFLLRSSYKKHRRIFFMITLLLLGLLVYSAAYYLHFAEELLLSQWFRTTIWIKLLGILFLVKHLERFLPDTKKVFVILLAGTFFLTFYNFTKYNKSSFPTTCLLGFSEKNPDMDIALKTRELTSPKALCLHPLFGLETFKFWSRRSCFVDWKHVVRSRKKVKVWATRIREIYGLDYTKNYCDNNMNIIELSMKNYLVNCRNNKEKLQKFGITHLILPTKYSLKNYKELYRNGKWILYSLE